MSISNLEKLVGVVIAGGILYCAGCIADIHKKTKVAVKELSKCTEVEISEGLIEHAVRDAVSREARRAAEKVAYDVSKNADRVVKMKVDEEINSVKRRIRDDVANQVADRVSSIDTLKFEKEIREAAKEKMIEKFSENLDDLIEKFKGNLDSLSSIYESVENSFSMREEKPKVFRIEF